MNSGNYETQILETIQLLVDNAVSKANYDRTIQGTISRCVDATIGKYIVKYQDSSLYAYSSNTDITYPAGSSVYVLVPGNDMTKDKTILGTVDKLGPDYVSIVEGENGYEVTGINVINNTDAMFELCSYKDEDIKILYDRDNNVDLVNLDTFGFESYIKKSNSIICGATFRTALPTEQKFRGDYGIGFSLDFIDNASGETITKTYIVNVDEMLGNPYNYTSASRQYGIFEVDGANFLSVKQIYIFEYDFPNTEENQANDIFISKVELSAANALEREAAATCALTFVTPQGIYFDDNDLDTDTRTIEAQIRIKGNAIDNDSQLVKYYWFIENNSITSKSEKFNQYGGAGWECLNQFNTIQAATEDTEALVEWVSGSYRYITAKKDNIAKETTYKCVAVYSNDTILSRTIVIYNHSSDYEISIKSNDGTTFYYDVGHPDLTCYVNGEELIGDDYSYIWSEVDNNNHLSILTSTKELNDTYNEAVVKYNELIAQVENEQKLSGQVQEDLDIYTRTIAQYESIMRVENNKIHNLTISRITNFSTYKCSVYKLGTFIGSASIIISNTLKNETGYYLVLENGNQVFKYNEQGISPASGSLLDPITVLPISFTLYNEQGQQINFNAIGLNNVHWKVPAASSMIQVSTVHGNPSEKTELYETYTGYPELNFSIDNRYDVRKENNEIELIVNYKDKVISAKTNLTFTKEGELGTNGTSFVCKIVPNIAKGVSPLYPLVTINEYNSQWELNYQPKEIDKWFKVQLWRDGEQIFEGTESGLTIENVEAQVQWSILKNNYGEAQDETNLIINKDTGAIALDLTKYNNPANIIKCVITYDNVDYYAAIPVAIARTIDENYFVEPVDRTGFRQVMYTADGKAPSYDSEYPFELRVSQLINGIKEDVSQLELSEFKVDYDWNVLGQVYFSKWQSELNLIEKTLYSSRAKRNQKYFKPVDEYNGLCVTNALSCTISRNHDRLAEIHIPVYFYINRYGNSAMNGWDGNSISIDDNNSGVILAPQVGAGKKNEDNTFTGVFMGSVKEAGADKIETGLFGYSAGQRTITLNSENGSAAFGATGSGQIIIDPSTGAALLRSGNFDREKGTGMQIDLSEPSIEFGSGNFGVDKNGQMYAAGFATTKFVRDELDTRDEQISDLENSIKLFDVAIDIPMVLIPCTSDRKPLATKTYTITTTGTFKGQDITSRMDVKLASAAINNIETVVDKNIITFTVTEGNEITEDVNNFIFLFTYKDRDNTYTINKSIALGLIAQGEDGVIGGDGKTSYIHIAYANSEDGKVDFSKTDGTNKKYFGQYTDFIEEGSDTPGDYTWTLIKGEDGGKGEDGKSAYQEWLDAGNTGSEEDFLNSLKGKDGDAGKSAYQLWLDAGNIGTEEDYLNSLKGEDGYTPVKGKDYDDGKDGADALNIKYVMTQYYLSDSEDSPIRGEWLDSLPEWQPNKYFWTRNKITWENDTITYSDAVLAEALTQANETANSAENTANDANSKADEANKTASDANSKADDANKTSQEAKDQAAQISQDLAGLTNVVNNNYTDLQGLIDGAIATWFYNYDPNTANTLPTKDWTTDEIKNQHLGDLFYIVDNDEKAGQCFRYALIDGVYKWVLVEDAEVTKAIASAAKAQETADGKATIYTGANTPSNPQNGDLWLKSKDDDILTYVNGKWEVYNKYTDDSTANEAKDIANNAKDQADAASQEVKNSVKNMVTEYYVSTSADELVGGEWSEAKPDWNSTNYIWSRQRIEYMDATKPVAYGTAACITGHPGQKGDTGKQGAGITSVTITYQAHDNGETAPTGEWLETIPTVEDGKYLWIKTKTTYSEGVPSTTSYSVSKMGAQGKDGEVGPGAKTITIAASAQFFKSTQGANGIFTPEYIYLYPTFQNTQYGKWQYSINGGIDWVDVSSGVADLTIGTYNERVNSLRIGRDSSLYTNEITSITFKCEADEDFDTIFSTISIAKIYDVTEIDAIKETKILYAITDTKDVNTIPDDAWVEVLVNVENKFIWQKVYTEYVNGVIDSGEPVCISSASTFITKVQMQYATSNDALTEPDENAWQYLKPEWIDGVYIWSRIETEWSDGQSTYSTPLCDVDAQNLQTSIEQHAQSIINNLENEGCVRLFNDKIYIMNASNEFQATEVLCLNQHGIGFAKKEKDVALENTQFTSVWALDGTFDAQSIEVINLGADNIRNGVLRLYDEGSNDQTGKMLIFEGPAPATPTDEYDERAVVKISSEGIHVKLANGSIFEVDIINGFKIKNPLGNEMLSTSADGNTINITRTKIIEHIDFGTNLRGLVMERETVDGKKHKGLGFIKI